MDLRLDIQPQAAQGCLQGPLAGCGDCGIGNLFGGEVALLQYPLHCRGNEAVVAEPGLEPAGERPQIVLLLGPPGAKKVLADGVGANDLSKHVPSANQHRPACITVVLFLL